MMSIPESTGHQREQRLIVICSRVSLSADIAGELRELLRAPDIDWEYILRVSSRNAVGPLVSSALLQHADDLLPPEIRQNLADLLTEHQARNLYLTAELIKIVNLFSRNGIRIMPFKGPVLSVQAYGSTCLRQFADLDVLVPRDGFVAAFELLTRNGFTPLTSANWLEKSNWYISRKKDIYFVNEDQSVTLELHWKLSGSHFGLPAEMDGLWKRVDGIKLGGTEVESLSFNDLLIYICLHGSRHSWERFQWICDVHELVLSRQADISWDEIVREARRLHCENVLALGLRLIREFFDVNIPATVGREPVYSQMASEIRSRLFSDSARTVKIGQRYIYHLKLRERMLDRWKVHLHYLSWYLRIILKPNEVDRSLVRLPNWMTPLHFFLRPIRLIYDRVSRSTR